VAKRLRALTLLVVVGVGTVAGSAVAGIAAELNGLPAAARAATTLGTAAVNTVSLLAGFALLTVARNRWRTLFSNFDPRLLAGSAAALLRADIAHARTLGWKGAAVPLLVWPMLPGIALRRRGAERRLSSWPAPPSAVSGSGS
jgi:hypothetical protein